MTDIAATMGCDSLDEFEVKLQDAKAKIVVSNMIKYLFVMIMFKLITN